ncbi:transglutaminase family protein [Bacteroides sp. 214]|uniref:transglutaminase-like domain-containing protein n=1 Tax=Bacteroides sp. 214 TaxID=2302935 RepID=UPI0013D6F09B|nr:transglutaminase family protein [Bacteroides sp. 214]NDW11629.1 transglutaminase family protein [Bacteroides sp. 214]
MTTRATLPPSFLILLFTATILLASCHRNTSRLEQALSHAATNQGELESVLNHYKASPADTLKYRAACFLIENMFHGYSYTPIMDEYREAVFAAPTLFRYQHDTIWTELSAQPSVSRTGVSRFIYDSSVITADYLIENIDEAFDAWQNAPWHNEIAFEAFCKYILPYRASDEPLSNWRKDLRAKFLPAITDVKSSEAAFVSIYNKVLTEFKKSNNAYPYGIDALLADKIQHGSCDNRSMYLVNVLRALGIPAVYDHTPFWGNFNSTGHSWVSYVRNDSTFSLTHKEQTLKLFGTIDASRFYQKNHNYDINTFSYRVDSVKKVPKVFRSGYEVQQAHIDWLNRSKDEVPSFFKNIYRKDVSEQYGLFASREISTTHRSPIYLCAFAAGKDWQPIAVAQPRHGKVLFEHLNNELVYIACRYENDSLIPISSPFYVTDNHIVHEIIADKTTTETIRLTRKYVLTFHWTDRWSLFLNGRFEGSNKPDFSSKTILHEITELPTGVEQITFSNPGKYRYIRFVARKDADPNFAEFAFLGKKELTDATQQEINGKLIYHDIEEISIVRGMDKDNSTFFRITNTPGVPLKGYWFGYDLGSNPDAYITGVSFCPMSDQNMIEPGDLYELFYFQEGWVSLGEQTATTNCLSYNNVPRNALLWLKNKTKGKEERIFTYKDGKQIWW